MRSLNALDWWSVFELDKVTNGTVEWMVSLEVAIAWLKISRNLTWFASSDRFPFSLNKSSNGSIKRMVGLEVAIAWLGVSRNLSWLASSNGLPFSLNVGSIKIVSTTVVVIAWFRIS